MSSIYKVECKHCMHQLKINTHAGSTEQLFCQWNYGAKLSASGLLAKV